MMTSDAASTPKKGHTRNARRRSRELAVQGLYQWFLNPVGVGELDAHIQDAPGFEKADFAHYKSLLYGSIRNMQVLSERLTPLLDRAWDELSPVEKAVLVVGGQELTTHPDIPYRVIINEAVELTKTFGGTDAHRFVNGVLDKLALQIRDVEVRSASKLSSDSSPDSLSSASESAESEEG